MTETRNLYHFFNNLPLNNHWAYNIICLLFIGYVDVMCSFPK